MLCIDFDFQKCYVDANGKFNAEAGEELEGKEVLKEGNQAVINMLGECQL